MADRMQGIRTQSYKRWAEFSCLLGYGLLLGFLRGMGSRLSSLICVVIAAYEDGEPTKVAQAS